MDIDRDKLWKVIRETLPEHVDQDYSTYEQAADAVTDAVIEQLTSTP